MPNLPPPMSFSESDYVAADATALAAAIARGDVTAQALWHFAVERAHRLQPAFGAICQFAAPRGDEAAVQAADPAGPFAGVPIVIKDLGAPMAGLPTWAGSRALSRVAVPAPVDGELVRRLRQAGFVPFAKTTVPEFGFNLASEPMVGPVCRNPWAPGFTAGGSSGGAAAAVAAGIVPVAHATDAGGSIRIPAAACGVVGLKPGRGALPQGPDYGNVFGTLAAEFVLTRSVRDGRSIWQTLTRRPATVDGARQWRIGVLLQAPQGTPIDAEWREAAHHAAALLQAEGHTLRAVDPARWAQPCADGAQAFATYACRSLAAAVDALQPAEGDLEPMSWAAARRGLALQAGDHQRAEICVARATEAVAALFDDIDVLLTPALACALPEVGVLRTDGEDLDAHLARFERYAPFAAVANAAGCPAIALPHGQDARQRPLSVQMMSRVGSEATLLALADTLERRAPWAPVAPGCRPGAAH